MKTWTKTPVRLLKLAACLAAVYLACHLLGLRESVSLLSGTLPATEEELFVGLFTVLAWFGAVLVAPVLALAAGLHLAVVAIVGRVVRVRSSRGARAGLTSRNQLLPSRP
jgi:hypothetical protein